jgi:hypothetical protein
MGLYPHWSRPPANFQVRRRLRQHPIGVYRSALTLVCVALVFAAANGQQQSAAASQSVHAEMHNVQYHFTDSSAVHIAQLEGELVSTAPAGIPIFDDPNSFNLKIHSAEISITTDALASALNQYAFAASDAPIKEIRISIQDGKLDIQGKLHSKGGIPFESVGSLSVTPEGEIRVHTEKVKAAHLPVKGLMDLLGQDIAKMIDTRKVRGVRAEKDDLILTPAEVFPPPHVLGALSSVVLRGNEIVMTYGIPTSHSGKNPGNYIAFTGGELHFGKLTMSDTDLILIDLDPQDPFDFFLVHYKEQLAAGYTKNTLSSGLRAYVRDYNKLTAKQKSHDEAVRPK